jgi:hypothetical protein
MYVGIESLSDTGALQEAATPCFGSELRKWLYIFATSPPSFSVVSYSALLRQCRHATALCEGAGATFQLTPKSVSKVVLRTHRLAQVVSFF